MSKFAKRHYEAIALAMQDSAPLPNWSPNKRAQFDVTVSRLADMFKADNGRFNRERFTAACELGANVRARTNYKIRRDCNENQLTTVAA